MKNQANLKTLILKTQALKFISVFIPGALIIYSIATIFSTPIESPYLFFVALISYAFATVGDLLKSSFLITLFSQRISTKKFIQDVLIIKLYLLSFAVSCFFIAYAFLSYESFLMQTSLFTIGSVINIAIILFLIAVVFDLTIIKGIKNQQHATKVKFKDFVIGIGFYIITVFGLISFFLVSLALTYVLALSSLLIYIFLFDGYLKKILTKSLRVKSLLTLVTVMFIISGLLMMAEYASGNKEYIYDNSHFEIMRSIFNLEQKVEEKIKSNKIDSFYKWKIMVKDKNITNLEFAQAFEKLEEVCPPKERANLFLVDCGRCFESFYTHSSEDVKGLANSDKLERLSALLDQNSEYSKLMAINYYLAIPKPSKEMSDKFNDQFKSGHDQLNQIGRLVSSKKESLMKNFYFMVLTGTQKDCPKRKSKRL